MKILKPSTNWHKDYTQIRGTVINTEYAEQKVFIINDEHLKTLHVLSTTYLKILFPMENDGFRLNFPIFNIHFIST